MGGEHDIAPAVVVDGEDALVFKGDEAHGGELLFPDVTADETVDGEILAVSVADHAVADVGLFFFTVLILIGAEVGDYDVAAGGHAVKEGPLLVGVAIVAELPVGEAVEDHRVGLAVREQDGEDLLGAAVGVVHIGLGAVALAQLTAEGVGVSVEPWPQVGEVGGEDQGFNVRSHAHSPATLMENAMAGRLFPPLRSAFSGVIRREKA